MTPRILAPCLALLLLTLTACGGGSPYRVESRDPTAAETQQTTYERLIREKRIQERTKGGGL